MVGNYSIGEMQSGKGMKQGEYKVRILATSGGVELRYVAEEYDNTNTSGLTYNVQGKTIYDITVEKP